MINYIYMLTENILNAAQLF